MWLVAGLTQSLKFNNSPKPNHRSAIFLKEIRIKPRRENPYGYEKRKNKSANQVLTLITD